MNIRLVNPEEYWDFITFGRRSIVKTLFPEPSDALEYPLRNAFYLIIFDDDKPIGFAEFFGYNQLFDSFQSCLYNNACDLSEVGQFSEFCHCRSLFILSTYRKNMRAYLNLIFAMSSLCVLVRKPFLTCTTGANHRYNRRLYMKSGMKDVGEFEMGGSKQTLFLVELADNLKETFPFSRGENISSRLILEQDKITNQVSRKLNSLEPSKAKVA